VQVHPAALPLDLMHLETTFEKGAANEFGKCSASAAPNPGWGRDLARPDHGAGRGHLSALARLLCWALIGLIIFGIITILVQIPGGALLYAVVGLVIFAGLTAFDFQRLRRSQDIRTAPLLAASIFLDILNVFLLLLSLFGGGRD
jgi:hypothetical protein